MTITEIKEQLPEIKVIHNNKLYKGKIRSRTPHKFTIVTIADINKNFVISWKSLEEHINKNKPIVY